MKIFWFEKRILQVFVCEVDQCFTFTKHVMSCLLTKSYFRQRGLAPIIMLVQCFLSRQSPGSIPTTTLSCLLSMFKGSLVPLVHVTDMNFLECTIFLVIFGEDLEGKFRLALK